MSLGETAVGILVGGASSRMGGQPKGLLRARDGVTIVERWRVLCDTLLLPCILVGEMPAYSHIDLDVLADARPSSGPLGGLVALMRSRPKKYVIAVACDMPYVTTEILARLAASDSTHAAIAPCRDSRYEPLFARYERARVLPVAEDLLDRGELSLQKLLKQIDAETLVLSDAEWSLLRDWDEPGDIA